MSALPDCLATLADLIAIDTTNPGGHEQAAVDYLHARLQRLQPDCLVAHPVAGPNGRASVSIYARWGTPRVLVNAHLDTVAVTTGWSGDPHRMRVDGDRLIGLGTADTKGAIAAALVALEQAAPRPRDCAVLFSGDEEQTNACLPAFLQTAEGQAAHTVVVCEPTGSRLGSRHRGIMVMEVHAHGVGGHSCFADTLPAPVTELARVGVRLADWARTYQADAPGEFRGLCLNLANIRGGTDYNIIPTQATLSLSLRPPPGSDVAALHTALQTQVLAASPTARLEAKLVLPAFQTAKLESFREYLGDHCDRAQGLGFWTEAALWSAAGANAVVFGPGQMTDAHTANEYIDRGELLAACALFRRWFEG